MDVDVDVRVGMELVMRVGRWGRGVQWRRNFVVCE